MTPAKLRPSRAPDVSLNQGLLATPPALGLCKRAGRTWPRAEGWGWGLPPPGAGLRGRGPAVSMASGAYLGGGACGGGGRPCAGWSGRRPGCSRGQPRPGSRPRPPRRPGPAGARGRAAACATGRPPGLGEGPRRGGGGRCPRQWAPSPRAQRSALPPGAHRKWRRWPCCWDR